LHNKPECKLLEGIHSGGCGHFLQLTLMIGHPAHPGYGLFANQVYNGGDIIGPYVGRVYSHGKQEERKWKEVVGKCSEKGEDLHYEN
jgi:hypothetical protein